MHKCHRRLVTAVTIDENRMRGEARRAELVEARRGRIFGVLRQAQDCLVSG